MLDYVAVLTIAPQDSPLWNKILIFSLIGAGMIIGPLLGLYYKRRK